MSDSASGNTKDTPREFLPVGPAEAKSLIEDGAKNLAAAMIWTRDQQRVINTHLSLVSESDHSLYFVTPKGLDPREFMDQLAKDGSQDCFFSLSLVRANIFFRSRFIGFQKATLQFRFPEKLFKVQRRTDIRFVIPNGYVVKVEFPDPLFPERKAQVKANDVSAGGFSFIVPADDANSYAPGLILQPISITLKNFSLTLEGEVRHTTVMPLGSKTPGVKVGIQFRNIRPGDSQRIANYVFEESRRHYSKFL